MLNLDQITLLMMHSVWAKPLTYRKTLGKVKWTWLCSASGRSPKKMSRNSCRSAQPLWLWYLALHRSAQQERRLWSCFCDMLTCVLVDIWTPCLYLPDSREVLCTLFHYSCLGSRQQVWELSPFLCCVLVWMSSLIQIKPVYVFNETTMRFEICLVSKSNLFFFSFQL